jgi:hypothetical protein
MKVNLSIHPARKMYAKGDYPSNTCKAGPDGRVRGYERKMTKKFDGRQADYQRTIAGNKNASAYTMPGSRRLDK